MLLTVVLIAGLEAFAVACFLLGHTLGRQFERASKCKLPKVELPDDVLDPITPEDQMLMKKLEEATPYGHTQKDEE